ncbi:hypothetical protein Ddye_024712 [Dipteronia dyeriana]|uniref:Uncharacterized protein n=1 Tax=Dipteronia dyeriana TaxID=168575 RepID=A0AAD9TWD1_9ROSI|nr:hypothetical protein Ddye_024712 [Dipteronia dyeriana]
MGIIPAPPLVLSVVSTATPQPTICRPKPDTQPLMTMTPFSAVAPPPFLAVSRQNIQLNLETIYEDKETDEDIIESSTPCSQFQTQKTSSITTTSFLSTCFYKVEKPFLGSALKI